MATRGVIPYAQSNTFSASPATYIGTDEFKHDLMLSSMLFHWWFSKLKWPTRSIIFQLTDLWSIVMQHEMTVVVFYQEMLTKAVSDF